LRNTDALISSANALAVFVREQWHWLLQRVTCDRRSAKLREGPGYDRLKEEQLSAIEKFVSGQENPLPTDFHLQYLIVWRDA